jgi:putative tricarboxylic transport membrane protein
MMAALAAALVETDQAASVEVIDLPGSDGAEAILRLGTSAGEPDIAGSCTPTYLTTPAKQHLAFTHRELTPLAGLVADTYLIVTRANHPRAELAAMFAEPTTAAAAPAGGNTHIQALLLEDAAGQKVTVSIQPDQVSAIDAVATGAADWTTGVATDFADGVAAGRLTVVGTFASSDADGPNLRSAGIDVTFQLWRGLIGPPELDAATVDRWAAGVQRARTTAAWRDYLASAGLKDLDLTAAEFGKLLDAEQVNYLGWLDRIQH